MKELFYFFGFFYIAWQIKEIITHWNKEKFIKKLDEMVNNPNKLKKENDNVMIEIFIGLAMFAWVLIGIFHAEESKWFLLNLILNFSLWIFCGILSLSFWKKENFDFIKLFTHTKDTMKDAVTFFDTSYIVIVNQLCKIGLTLYILGLHFQLC